jgi:glycosyltransferase involved in cell wall biosynthesis
MSASVGKGRRILFIVENLPSPFDRRVWQEATTLHNAGYAVIIICPTGKGCDAGHEHLDGIHIYRHSLPTEGAGVLGYMAEYSAALLHEFRLTFKVWRRHGFDAIHACNPPDLIFLVGGLFKFAFGKKFVFDHHDINPELYEAKFGKRGFFYWLMLKLERLTFQVADLSIATNESFRKIAIERGRMPPDKVHVVRSGPMLQRLRIVDGDPSLRQGRRYLVGYVGVMGKQEGLDLLLEVVAHLVHRLRRVDIHFGLVGDGTELPKLRVLARELDVTEFVTFTGRVDDDLMLRMLNTADVCVNPDAPTAMNDKSTMNKVMEYMALAKPIVQFDLTEGRISAGAASLYAVPGDILSFAQCIVELLEDPQRRATMGEFGRRRIEQELEWRYEAPKLLAVYEQLFGGAAAAAPSRVGHQ